MKYYLFFFTFFFSVSLLAGNVTAEKAHDVAAIFFKGNAPQMRVMSPQLELVWNGETTLTRSEVSAPAFYVFNRTDAAGFVVVSGDDIVHPILAYSIGQPFKADNMPANLIAWMNSYREQIKWIRKNHSDPSDRYSEVWNNPQSLSDITGREQTKQLTTALWDQGEPYNRLCPTDDKGKLTPAGCVATALAIVMKYHQWPDKGNGELKEYVSKSLKKSLTATFSRKYDWGNMPIEYIPGEYTEKEANNVAALIYHSGVMSEMDYNTGASGAITTTAISGMIRYMKYDKGASLLMREWYTMDEWETIVKTEIDALRPIIYGGSNKKGEGHQFLIDGYNSEGYFHINWGWGGISNGLFKLSALDPNEQGSGGNSGGGFSQNQDIVVGIKKAEENTSYNHVLAFFSGTSAGEKYAGLEVSTTDFSTDKSFTMKAGFVGNFSFNDFNGMVAFALADKNKNIKELISKSFVTDPIPNMHGTAVKDINCKILKELSPGDRIVMVYKEKNEEKWKLIKGGNDVTTEIVVKPDITSIEDITSKSQSLSVSYDTDANMIVSASTPIRLITIYDINGRQLIQVKGTSKNESISDYLPTGIYLLQALTENGHEECKFIKK